MKSSITQFLAKRLKLKVNEEKSAVDRPCKRKFPVYSMTFHQEPRLNDAPASIKRLKCELCKLLRQGQGRNINQFVETLTPILRGWVNYFQFTEVNGIFKKKPDGWIRCNLRCILSLQWKKPKTRASTWN